MQVVVADPAEKTEFGPGPERLVVQHLQHCFELLTLRRFGKAHDIGADRAAAERDKHPHPRPDTFRQLRWHTVVETALQRQRDHHFDGHVLSKWLSIGGWCGSHGAASIVQDHPDDKGKIGAVDGALMSLFLLTFFLVYGSAQGYFLLRAWQGLSLGRCGAAWLSLWLLAMVLAPVAVRLLEREGHERLARTAAYIGYCWMGFLFLFVSLMLVLDLLRFGRYLAAFFVRLPSLPLFEPRPLFVTVAALAVGIALYGWFEALQLRTVYLVLPTAKLPAGSPRVRIVQLSDLHVGLIVRDGRVQKVVQAVRQAAPDLVVATGDMVDGHVGHFDGVAELFRGIAPPLGMFAVTGNHEYYAGIGQATAFLKQCGFQLLRNEHREVGPYLTLVGVDDPASGQPDQSSIEGRLLAEVPQRRFVLLLKHRPEIAAASRGRFDLQLSGHVHGGQIFPFSLLTWLRFPLMAGLHRLSEGEALYVSRGCGTWGPPIRFLEPPEVTVIDLVPTSTSSAAPYGRSS